MGAGLAYSNRWLASDHRGRVQPHPAEANKLVRRAIDEIISRDKRRISESYGSKRSPTQGTERKRSVARHQGA